ncbi:hypothetical protein Tco_1367606 [Tanacetum coccineum]
MENHNTETSNKENEDTVPEKEIITDEIYNWITAKYRAPNETWNGDQIALVADDVVKTFFDKSDSKQDVPECSTKDVASPIASTNIEEAEDDTDEEAEDDTEDDTDDETWSPKTIGTTSKKGATSSSSPSTKKTIVNRGEPEYRQRQEDIRFYLQLYDHLTGDARLEMEELREEIKAKYDLQY